MYEKSTKLQKTKFFIILEVEQKNFDLHLNKKRFFKLKSFA